MQIKDVEAGYKHSIIILVCSHSLWLLVFLKRKLFTVFTDLQCSDHSKDTDCIKLETKRGDTVWQFQQNGDRLLQRPSGQCEQAGRARWAEEVICQQDRSKFNRWTNTPQSPSRAQHCDAHTLSTVRFCHASLVTLLPLTLSPPHSSLEHFQYVTVNCKPAALPCSSGD